MARAFAFLLAAVAIATAASIEHIPTDSRVYDDIDLLKTAGLIRSMPYTSRPWTRAQAAQWVSEVESLVPLRRLGVSQRAALRRLERELADELIEPWSRRRKPLVDVPVPDVPGAHARLDGFARGRATSDSQSLGLGIVASNRPGDDFAFYDRLEFTLFNPEFVRDSAPRDSAGWHMPGKRVLPWQGRLTVESELAYIAFRLPWLRLEVGRDEFSWGPGYRSSVMLSDAAPALDHLQLSAAYRNFRFITFTSLLSRWDTRPRFLSAQRLEVSLFEHLTLGGAMMSVASWDEVQPAQLGGLINPLIPIYFSVANSGHDENLLMGFDAVGYLSPVKAYAQLFIDNYEFNDRRGAPNAVGLQAGLYASPRLPVDARLEYTRVTAFTYYHRVHSTMYENYLVPLGHCIGPDADQALAVAR
ncbi:MAG: capsule assembly Wzi family protein, partial [bacterium]